MRLKSSSKQKDDTCSKDEYCVQLYSRRATLVSEFCLNKKENNIPDIEAAEESMRQILAPCDFAGTTVSLISGEGTNDETTLQFDSQHA